MKRALLALMASTIGLVSLFGYQPQDLALANAEGETGNTGDGVAAGATVDDVVNGQPATTSTTAAAAQPTSRQATTTTAATSTARRTITGNTASTAYGDVVVSLTVEGRKIVAVDVPKFPNTSSTSKSLSANAIPKLKAATIKAQSANVSSISGATSTSEGFTNSLESALSKL